MVNVLLYVAFLLPFTGLAVYQKTEENRLCGYEPALKVPRPVETGIRLRF